MTKMTPLRSSQRQLPMWGFQRKAFEFVAYHGNVYLMLDMGMGKTRICIELGRVMDYPLFVLAPRFAALETWPDEFQKWDPGAKVAVLHGKNKEEIWANSDKYTNIILNYDGLKWFYDVVQKKRRPLQKYFFVYDEASMLKNWESNRWLITNTMRQVASPYTVALSGTPMPNEHIDLWSQYFLLDGGKALGGEVYQYKNRFFDYDPERYSTTIKPGAAKKIHQLVKPITMRLAAEDYLDLPELVHNPIRLTLPLGVRRMYHKLEEDFMLEFEDSKVMANSSAILDHKLRQLMQGALYSKDVSAVGSQHRLPTVTEFIHTAKAEVVKQLISQALGKPMLIAVQFKFEIKILEKVLRKKIPFITGATSGPAGKRLIQKWNRGELPFMVVHPKSVAYSLNLQHGGSHLVIMALPWELDLYQQILKRLHRPGQKDRVVITTISFKHTVDEKVERYIRRKDGSQEGLFNAMRRAA